MFSCCCANPKATKKDKHNKINDDNEDAAANENETNEAKDAAPSPKATDKAEEVKEEEKEEQQVVVVNVNEKCEERVENPAEGKSEEIPLSDEEVTVTMTSTPEPTAMPLPALTESDASSMTAATVDSKAKPETAAAELKNIAVQTSPIATSSTSTAATMTSATAENVDEAAVEVSSCHKKPSKSCLSRHNSTHHSIKKKVNISTRAEIIEPEPEPDALLLANGCSQQDDDEVFSDSLPPPKRESMCAPYIEADQVSESLAFAHGLPSWFDDERLNEIGCIEPPVTPVGRDELELKRQRLYTELLRAAHAAVEHSVAVRSSDNDEAKPTAAVEHLESICERLETLVDRLERTLIVPAQSQPQSSSEPKEIVAAVQSPPIATPTNNMSVHGFEDIVAGPLSQYLALSAKIGGDVAQHANLVKLAFDAQLKYVTLATQIAQPPQPKQMELLKPTSTQISAIQDYREKQRSSPYFNHLSAISESIPALGWVCVSPTPGPHVKEMNDAGQFYTNRVLKEWKEKNVTHVEWARAWIQTLTELQAYIKQYHTTGLVWSGKGAAPAGGAPPPPPPGGMPPPPPMLDLAALKLEGDGSADERSALFAQINQGADITKNLKKVTGDMQTHKNPSLRTGPAPFKTPAQSSAGAAAPAVAKEPVFARDGKKWLIEYQKNNSGLLVDQAEMNNVVYVFRCENSTITVKGKVNNIVLDSCKKCSLLFDSVVASVEFVNCQSVQMQVLGFVPTVIIDKSDGCQMYLSKESLGIEIVSSKSSEMNVLLPLANGDFNELAMPEQYKTTIVGKTLKTVCVDSLG